MCICNKKKIAKALLFVSIPNVDNSLYQSRRLINHERFVLGFESVVIEGKRNEVPAVYTGMNELLRIYGKRVHSRYIWHT